MIKRTLYFGNPAYLSTAQEQLVVTFKDAEKKSAPIEDIGLVILDHQQITITQCAISKLLANNVALITCNETHHPTGLMLNLEGHSLQTQKFIAQSSASVPLKKQLWQATVMAKIENQAHVLSRQGKEASHLYRLSRAVKSNDSENLEAQAAAWYWKRVFPEHLDFNRSRGGLPPNNLLNYGYAILRALVARSLVGSGLHPTLGIFHRNQYNAYCLADDIMEPYRPFVDDHICGLLDEWMTDGTLPQELGTEHKRALLAIPTLDVIMNRQRSPLLAAVQRTTASLSRCFEEGDSGHISYPSFI